MNHDSEAERARFEAWLTNVYFSGLEGAGDWDEARNCYVRLDTHMAWKGWQAALMSRQAPSTPDVSQEGGKGDTST